MEDSDDETKEAFEARLTSVINQMMFVSGETAEVPPETTSMIEEIVRQQVIFMVGSYPLRQMLFSFLTAEYRYLNRFNSSLNALPKLPAAGFAPSPRTT
jgi:hypothetical protein